jgi:hypothetical protein
MSCVSDLNGLLFGDESFDVHSPAGTVASPSRSIRSAKSHASPCKSRHSMASPLNEASPTGLDFWCGSPSDYMRSPDNSSKCSSDEDEEEERSAADTNASEARTVRTAKTSNRRRRASRNRENSLDPLGNRRIPPPSLSHLGSDNMDPVESTMASLRSPKVVHYVDEKSKAIERKTELELLRQQSLAKPKGMSSRPSTSGASQQKSNRPFLNFLLPHFYHLLKSSAAMLSNAAVPLGISKFHDQQREMTQQQKRSHQDAMEFLHKYRADEGLVFSQTSATNIQPPRRPHETPRKPPDATAASAPAYATMMEIDLFLKEQRIQSLAAEHIRSFESLQSEQSQEIKAQQSNDLQRDRYYVAPSAASDDVASSYEKWDDKCGVCSFTIFGCGAKEKHQKPLEITFAPCLKDVRGQVSQEKIDPHLMPSLMSMEGTPAFQKITEALDELFDEATQIPLPESPTSSSERESTKKSASDDLRIMTFEKENTAQGPMGQDLEQSVMPTDQKIGWNEPETCQAEQQTEDQKEEGTQPVDSFEMESVLERQGLMSGSPTPKAMSPIFSTYQGQEASGQTYKMEEMNIGWTQQDSTIGSVPSDSDLSAILSAFVKTHLDFATPADEHAAIRDNEQASVDESNIPSSPLSACFSGVESLTSQGLAGESDKKHALVASAVEGSHNGAARLSKCLSEIGSLMILATEITNTAVQKNRILCLSTCQEVEPVEGDLRFLEKANETEALFNSSSLDRDGGKAQFEYLDTIASKDLIAFSASGDLMAFSESYCSMKKDLMPPMESSRSIQAESSSGTNSDEAVPLKSVAAPQSISLIDPIEFGNFWSIECKNEGKGLKVDQLVSIDSSTYVSETMFGDPPLDANEDWSWAKPREASCVESTNDTWPERQSISSAGSVEHDSRLTIVELCTLPRLDRGDQDGADSQTQGETSDESTPVSVSEIEPMGRVTGHKHQDGNTLPLLETPSDADDPTFVPTGNEDEKEEAYSFLGNLMELAIAVQERQSDNVSIKLRDVDDTVDTTDEIATLRANEGAATKQDPNSESLSENDLDSTMNVAAFDEPKTEILERHSSIPNEEANVISGKETIHESSENTLIAVYHPASPTESTENRWVPVLSNGSDPIDVVANGATIENDSFCELAEETMVVLKTAISVDHRKEEDPVAAVSRVGVSEINASQEKMPLPLNSKEKCDASQKKTESHVGKTIGFPQKHDQQSDPQLLRSVESLEALINLEAESDSYDSLDIESESIEMTKSGHLEIVGSIELDSTIGGSEDLSSKSYDVSEEMKTALPAGSSVDLIGCHRIARDASGNPNYAGDEVLKSSSGSAQFSSVSNQSSSDGALRPDPSGTLIPTESTDKIVQSFGLEYVPSVESNFSGHIEISVSSSSKSAAGPVESIEASFSDRIDIHVSSSSKDAAAPIESIEASFSDHMDIVVSSSSKSSAAPIASIESTLSGRIHINVSSSSKSSAALIDGGFLDTLLDASSSEGSGEETRSSGSFDADSCASAESASPSSEIGFLCSNEEAELATPQNLLKKPQCFEVFKDFAASKGTPSRTHLSRIVPPRAMARAAERLNSLNCVAVDLSPSSSVISPNHQKRVTSLKKVPLYVRRAPEKAKIFEGPTCHQQYAPNLHQSREACERCLYWASSEEKEKFQAEGHHLRIMLVRGGCDRGCTVFPRENDELPVRLCRKCYFDTHKNATT